MSCGSTAIDCRYFSGSAAPAAKLTPGSGTNLRPSPADQPPESSGNVTAPTRLRQNSPARQYGGPAAQPSDGDVALPATVTQPPLPSASMWYMRPSSPRPWPSIDT